MMQAALLPKWKNAFISTQIPHSAYFHSTQQSLKKLKSMFNNLATAYRLEEWRAMLENSDKRGCQQPAKKFIIRSTTEKRSHPNNALNDTLLCNGFSNISSESFLEKFEEEEEDHAGMEPRSNAAAMRYSRSLKAKRQLKRRRENLNIFHATFGNEWYTLAFRSSEDATSRSTTTGSDWREGSNWSRRRMINESDIYSESCSTGKDSDRLVLGLPAKGPLKIDDKIAFHQAALKWLPDRHQGPTQGLEYSVYCFDVTLAQFMHILEHKTCSKNV